MLEGIHREFFLGSITIKTRQQQSLTFLKQIKTVSHGLNADETQIKQNLVCLLDNRVA